jgi:hypothetical protein
MARVAGNNPEFMAQLREKIRRLPAGWTGQCEDVRLDWDGVAPRHPNCWGPGISWALKQGLLRHLTDEANMKAKRSNGRLTHLLIRTEVGHELD